MDDEAIESEAWYVNSLARGLKVLLAFSQRQEALSTSEVAELTGLSRAATRRFLMTLRYLGYLRSVDNRFVLSAKALDLGYAYLSTSGIVELVQPILETLSATCSETSSLAILEGEEVIYVARTPTRRMIALRVGIGSRIPAYASSLGKAILAFTEQAEADALIETFELKALTPKTIADPALFREEIRTVRANGYAVTASELEVGVASIAVPIMASDGSVIAALNISTHESIHAPQDLRDKFLEPLLNTKADIEAALSAVPHLTLKSRG